MPVFRGRPEDMTMARPAYVVNPSMPSSDLLASVAAGDDDCLSEACRPLGKERGIFLAQVLRPRRDLKVALLKLCRSKYVLLYGPAGKCRCAHVKTAPVSLCCCAYSREF